MAALSSRPIDRLVRQGVPLLTALVAVGLDLLPLPDASPAAVAPVLAIVTVYYWSLHRPDLMGPVAVAGIGLVQDLVAGTPPGLTSLVLLLVHGLAGSAEAVGRLRSPLLAWGTFLLVATAALALRWLAMSLWSLQLFPLRPALFELALTVVVYPLPAGLLSLLDSRIAASPHAPGL
ncbi:MAG: rod shape-determining protein MreD [Geminicoccaceae bacterium]